MTQSGMKKKVKKMKKMKKQLAEIKKELKILYVGTNIVIHIIEDGELSRSFIMHHLHEIYVRLETLIDKINTMEGK